MEDLIYMILGIAMIYSWVHSVVIVVKKISGLTSYEKVVMWVGIVGFALIALDAMYPS